MARWKIAACVVAVGAIASTAASREAGACSCDPYDATSVPADGATGVPLNAQILLYKGPPVSPPADLVLTGPAGEVPITVEQVEDNYGPRMLIVTPLAALAPSSTYTFNESWPIPGFSFTTGEADDLAAPAAPTVGELWLATATDDPVDGYSSCGGEFYDFDLPMAIGDDAVAVEITVITDTSSLRFIVLPAQFDVLSNWNGFCGPWVWLLPGVVHHVEVRARDLAGNLSEPVHRSATAVDCPTIPDFECTEIWDTHLKGCLDGYDGCPVVETPDDSGGCSTTPATSLGAALVLLGLRRRRRHTSSAQWYSAPRSAE